MRAIFMRQPRTLQYMMRPSSVQHLFPYQGLSTCGMPNDCVKSRLDSCGYIQLLMGYGSHCYLE